MAVGAGPCCGAAIVAKLMDAGVEAGSGALGADKGSSEGSVMARKRRAMGGKSPLEGLAMGEDAFFEGC